MSFEHELQREHESESKPALGLSLRYEAKGEQ